MVIKAGGAARAFAAAAAGTAAVLLTVFAQDGKEGAAQGITLCLKTLVPSLFPFMAVTQFAVLSGLCGRIGRILNRVTSALFSLGGSFAAVFLLSMIGGYPVGAAGIRQLYSNKELTRAQAQRAALFSVGAGPGFLLGYVGASVYGSTRVGVYLLLSQTAAAVLLGIASKSFVKENYNSKIENKAPPLSYSRALTEAVYGASRSMAAVMGFVVLFSSLQSILFRFVTGEWARTVLCLTLEVCGAVNSLAGKQPIELVAFAVGFGGLCVHCQIMASLGEIGVKKGLFFLYRIIQGLLTALFTHVLLRLTPQSAEVFSTAVASNGTPYRGSVLSGAMLVAVSVTFLLSFRQAKNR